MRVYAVSVFWAKVTLRFSFLKVFLFRLEANQITFTKIFVADLLRECIKFSIFCVPFPLYKYVQI
jgi:hypothetical protein